MLISRRRDNNGFYLNEARVAESNIETSNMKSPPMPSESTHDRAVRTFFTQTGEETDVVRVCRGLSCQLNGGGALAERVGRTSSTQAVYCLGCCDRSPALLLPGDAVVCGAAALAWPTPGALATGESNPVVRSLSRRPVVTERIGRADHSSLATARQAGVYGGLAKALAGTPQSLLAVVDASGELGRGGAGFPTGRKWQACAAAASSKRYAVANGDEGDPGSFIDRVLLERDPHAVLEGLLLCGFAIGASEGVVFIRSEYPTARAVMAQAIIEAREAGLLGSSVMGYPFSFDARVVSGRGSYVCGEETALLNAIEGRRGEVRVRPPYPADAGLYDHPTVVNNIETLVNVPWIVREGPEAYRQLGTPGSPGTKAICLNRGFARPGIIEIEFGLNLRELIEVHAGGAREAGGFAAVALGGPMGSVLPPEEWDLSIDYPVLRSRGVRLGHGGIVAIPANANLADVLLNWIEFMAAESCGKCTPCSAGSRQAMDLAMRLRRLPLPDARLVGDLTRLMTTVQATSLCGFGQGIAEPVMTLAKLALCKADLAGNTDG